MKNILTFIVMLPYGIMMSGPFAITGTIVGFILGFLLGAWLL